MYFRQFSFWKLILGLLVMVVVLNPYTVLGKPAVLISASFALYSLSSREFRVLLGRDLFLFMGLILISLIGVISSIFHGIEQYTHLWTSVSWVLTVFTGIGVYVIYNRMNYSINDLIYALFLGLLANSIIISAELIFPSFRVFVESFLVEAGNQLYDDGFKFRGIASSGGANLSLVIPSAIALALYLYSEKLIDIFLLLFSVSILVFSATLIGRTGLLMLPLPILLYFVYYRKYIVTVDGFARIFPIFVSFLFAAPVLFIISSDYLSSEYGDDFVKYSFGFLLEGRDGLKNEGTADLIAEFLAVLPSEFPEVIIGYGFYGGSDFFPWTDSGYSRMFLSVGFLFGFLFYFLLFRWFYLSGAMFFYPIAVMLALLVITETKEPFLISGYVARLVVIISVFYFLSKSRKKVNASFA